MLNLWTEFTSLQKVNLHKIFLDRNYIPPVICFYIYFFYCLMNCLNINCVTIYKTNCLDIMTLKNLPTICLSAKKHKNPDSENEATQNYYAFLCAGSIIKS